MMVLIARESLEKAPFSSLVMSHIFFDGASVAGKT
jgi:hypothetical protein